MKLKKVMIAILLVITMISLAGCANPISMVKNLLEDTEDSGTASNIIENVDQAQQENELRNTVLYYKNDKGFLIPVMQKIPWTEGRGIAKAVLRAMVDNPANREEIKALGLTPIIPANTEIKGMSIKDGLCKVDFSKEFTNYFSKAEEDALVKSVIYVLTEFPTVDKVQLMIEGKTPESLEFGTNTQTAMSRDYINYVSETPSEDAVVVYFEGTSNGLESYFLPITKAVAKQDASEVNVLDALDVLVQGPPEGYDLYSEIPKGTRVVSVDINNSVACINLTEEMLEVADNQNALSKVAKSFGLTVREQYPMVAGVKLLVNGKELKIGDQDKEEPVAVPTFANQYE